MKLDKVATVKLAFENYEELEIPISDIDVLYMDGITESIHVYSKPLQQQQMYRYKDVRYFRIIFENRPEYKRVFDHKDIAQVHLYDADGNEEWFFVRWGEGEYENELQETKVYRFGKIDITVAEESQR
jgi:hypothetical protein